MYVCMYVYVYICLCVFVRVFVCLCVCVCVCVCVNYINKQGGSRWSGSIQDGGCKQWASRNGRTVS
jgi:hypothetical protein